MIYPSSVGGTPLLRIALSLGGGGGSERRATLNRYHYGTLMAALGMCPSLGFLLL